MGRHRRVRLALGARSTVVKAAAAMGVATALAAGINSAANGPMNPQAAADTTGDPVNLAGSSSPEGSHHTGSAASAHQSVPTGFATQSAVAPKLIQPAVSHASKTATQAVQTAARTTPSGTATQAPAPGASQAPTPPASTAPGDSGSQPPASQAPAPPSQGSGSGSSGHQNPVGGLLGGVVGTVGGVVDGLLG